MKKDVLQTYAAYNNNPEIRLASSSGGLFTLFAEKNIANGGVVYGVTMSDDCYSSVFVRVDKKEDLYKLRGSKYIQANVGDAFKKVKKDLENNIDVLFSGTGCQINGLKTFLQKEYTNLICIDVICHGVPSQMLWKKYVMHMEEKYGKLEKINFRSKKTENSNDGYETRQRYIPKDDDAFFQFFNRCYALRPSCYQCVAKDIKCADLTIADFWGIEKVLPEMNREKGVSLILVRTKKGESWFNAINKECTYKECTYEDGVRENSAEYISHIRPKERDSFYVDLQKLTIPQMGKKYLHVNLKTAIKEKIKKILCIFTNKTSSAVGGGYYFLYSYKTK